MLRFAYLGEKKMAGVSKLRYENVIFGDLFTFSVCILGNKRHTKKGVRPKKWRKTNLTTFKTVSIQKNSNNRVRIHILITKTTHFFIRWR